MSQNTKLRCIIYKCTRNDFQEITILMAHCWHSVYFKVEFDPKNNNCSPVNYWPVGVQMQCAGSYWEISGIRNRQDHALYFNKTCIHDTVNTLCILHMTHVSWWKNCKLFKEQSRSTFMAFCLLVGCPTTDPQETWKN